MAVRDSTMDNDAVGVQLMIDWPTVRYFNPEFPGEGVFKQVQDLIEPGLIYALDRFRDYLGQAVHPSPDPAAWARPAGDRASQHYVELADNGQAIHKSRAGDVFPQGDIREAFQIAAGMREFGGIGVYLDTQYGGKPRPMMHLDIRPISVAIWWVRIGGRYFYAHREKERDVFYKALAGQI